MRRTTIDTIAAKFGGQTRWAEAIGRNQSTIAKWKERGITRDGMERTLEASRRLGIPIDVQEFFTTDGEAA